MGSRTRWLFGVSLLVILATATTASGAAAQSLPAPAAQATACVPDTTTLCLNNGRFEVQVHWTTAQGASGAGTAVPLTNDTGYFWFFDETNTEVVLKVLDGCALNQSFWVFAAGLTDLDVLITLTDTRTGSVATYRNRQGTPFAPIQDISAFRTCDAPGQAAAGKIGRIGRSGRIGRITEDFGEVVQQQGPLSASQAVCVPGGTRLCLDSGRFSVEAAWTTPDGKSGQGQAVPLSTNAGYFWFFAPTNVEVVVKVLRGCSLNQRFWVYAAGLTNVEVTFTVTDVLTGTSRTYHNPPNQAFAPILDTSALAACLPSCNTKGLTVADVQSAAEQSTVGAGDPFGADFGLVLNRFMTLEACDLGGDSPALPPGASARDCANFFCSDVQYCGPGNSQKSWPLGALSVGDALNGACFQHDTCYAEQCYPGDCYFLPSLTGACDRSLLAICDSILQNGQAACENTGDCLVCVLAKGLYDVSHNPRATPNDCQATPCADPFGLVCNQSAGRCASGCVSALSPIRQAIGSAGGSGAVAVTAPPDCDWTPVSNAGWITVTSGGSGNGSFLYSVAASDTISQRAGAIAVAGQTLALAQGGAPCSYSIDPASQAFGTSGGSGAVAVTTLAGCAWTAASFADWITITSGGSGSGDGTVHYTVTSSNTSSQRSGTLLIAGQVFTVTEDAVPCSYSVSPPNQAFARDGGSGSAIVFTILDCPWTAESNADWITITSGGSGAGNGTLTYAVAANDTASPRSGNLTIAGQTLIVSEDSAACTYSIDSAGQGFGASGGNGSVNVTTLAGCDWTAASNDSWINVSPGNGSGAGTVSYSVDANDSGNPRTGSLTIAGQVFTVTQDGVPCTYSISSSGAFFGPDGGSDSVAVTAPRDCEWTASSDSFWISASGSGSGDGTVFYSVAFNPDTEARTGSLFIAGFSIAVTQAGQPAAAAAQAAPPASAGGAGAPGGGGGGTAPQRR
ncbi:MAG TPA: BACON domain-containing carbohydrate-binding protein [Thermoanaerobaculia bacterium]|nr:BACON domain-containing carbohydrate-binding protein [Thermoanaerobaculia bacterium]